jgi:CheY-like chemotaxis protein
MHVNEAIAQFVKADKIRLTQVRSLALNTESNKIIVNLTNNAIKFTPPGRSVDVFVECTREPVCCQRMNKDINEAKKKQSNDSAKTFVSVRVVDRGIGIAQEHIDKLFQPFYQVSRNSIEGSGLGLYICMELAHLLGGHVCCKSELGHGSEFGFVVPIDVASDAEQQEDEQVPEDVKCIMQTQKVLVAEDNKVNQRVVANMLERLGCSFDIANNGKEACEMFEENDYFAVLMDMMMPVMDGFEATRSIVASSKYAIRKPVISALTASVTENEVNEARKAGCTTIISKPMSMDVLARTLRSAAQRRAALANRFVLGSKQRKMTVLATTQ